MKKVIASITALLVAMLSFTSCVVSTSLENIDDVKEIEENGEVSEDKADEETEETDADSETSEDNNEAISEEEVQQAEDKTDDKTDDKAASRIMPDELAEDACGNNLTWKVENGVLTISGSGEMWDYDDAHYLPWKSSEAITEIVVEEGVTGIGNNAFRSLSAMSVSLPDSLTRIGDYAFCYCDDIKNVDFPANLEEIGVWAFRNMSSAEFSPLPASIKHIGDAAFYKCDKIKVLEIAPDSEHFTIVDGILYNKDMTKLYYCPPSQISGEFLVPETVTTIGGHAFGDCKNLKKVVMSDNVTTLENGAFYWCENLSEIVLSKNITSIGSHAFNNCNKLGAIVLPDTLTEIGESAVSLTAITEISIPAGVKVLNDSVLCYCTNLERVYLPAGIEQIHENAFMASTNLKTVYFAGTEEQFGRIEVISDDGDLLGDVFENITVVYNS